MTDMWNVGTGAGGGIFGAIFAFLGLKHHITTIDKRIEKLSSNVVYKDTCQECHNSTHAALKSINDMQKETRADIKNILKELKK